MEESDANNDDDSDDDNIIVPVLSPPKKAKIAECSDAKVAIILSCTFNPPSKKQDLTVLCKIL